MLPITNKNFVFYEYLECSHFLVKNNGLFFPFCQRIIYMEGGEEAP
jgi:hypothetical protein